MFLALDPATRTGWAHWAPGMARPASGSFELPSSPDDLGRAGFVLHRELARLLKDHGFQRVYYEAPLPPSRMMGVTQLHTIAKVFCIASHIESFCCALNLRCRQVPQGAWRKAFVGKGGGEKSATFKAWARERCEQLGWPVRSHDEAEACGILHYAIGLDRNFMPPWFESSMMFQDLGKPRQRKAG
jgi:hypothetical protein